MQGTGVYTITNRVDGKVYVGCARDSFRQRWSRHKYYLKRHNHPNKLLRRAVEEFGVDNFAFEILDECPPDLCYGIEQYWMNVLQSYNPIYGYNMLPNAANSRGLKQSEEARHKMRTVPKGSKKNRPPHVRGKRVVKLNDAFEFLSAYKTVTAGAASVGVTTTSVVDVCKGRHGKSGGFRWMYEKDFLNKNADTSKV